MTTMENNMTTDVNKLLGAYLGKEAQALTEDQAKEAEIQLFLKAAADNNINVDTLPDNELESLFSNFQSKLAAEAASATPAATDTDKAMEQLKEAAAKEWQANATQQAEFEKAASLGRHMAESFYAHLEGIRTGAVKVAELPPQFLQHKKDGEKPEEKKDEKKDEKPEEKKEEKKEASALSDLPALDRLAATQAITLAKEGGFDPDQAARKVAAVLELGASKPERSVKQASQLTFDQTVNTRALELLETAGYPVTWQ